MELTEHQTETLRHLRKHARGRALYVAWRHHDDVGRLVGIDAVVIRPGEGSEALDPRLDLRSHSPAYGYGYEGLGSAQLALALLGDALDDEQALRHYQAFNGAHVAKWFRDLHHIDTAEILAWVEVANA